MFEARLRVAFRGVPGEEKVRDQEYRVLTHDHRIMNPWNWTELVSPRSKLRMSIVLCGAIMNDRFCPQPACRARDTQCMAVRDGGVMVTWYVLPSSYNIFSPRSSPTTAPSAKQHRIPAMSAFRCILILTRIVSRP